MSILTLKLINSNFLYVTHFITEALRNNSKKRFLPQVCLFGQDYTTYGSSIDINIDISLA